MGVGKCVGRLRVMRGWGSFGGPRGRLCVCMQGLVRGLQLRFCELWLGKLQGQLLVGEGALVGERVGLSLVGWVSLWLDEESLLGKGSLRWEWQLCMGASAQKRR